MPWGSNLTDMIQVLFNCLRAWVYIYGFWLYSSELFHSTFPVVVIIGSFALFIGVQYLRIPPPDASIIRDIIGVDPITLADETQIPAGEYLMKTCAHRFAGLDAPENSLSAIRKALEKGCTAVEFDVALTRDNVAILFHDSDINRLCNATGTIKDMTFDQLQMLDISSKHPLSQRFTGERIPKLEDAIRLCLDSGLRMFIDLKGDDFKIVPIVLDLFRRHAELYSRAVVSSFNPVLVYLIRRADSRIAGSLAWRPFLYSHGHFSGLLGPERPTYANPFAHYAARVAETLYDFLLNNFVYYLLGLSTVLLHKDFLSARVALKWRKRGVRPIAYTVNLPIEKQYFRRVLKVTYMTDTLDSEGL